MHLLGSMLYSIQNIDGFKTYSTCIACENTTANVQYNIQYSIVMHSAMATQPLQCSTVLYTAAV